MKKIFAICVLSLYCIAFAETSPTATDSTVRLEFLPPLPSSLQPYKEDGRYYNFKGEKHETSIFDHIYYLFQGSRDSPSFGDLTSWHRVDWKGPERSIEPKITWMGHSSVLIQAEGINLLFDPRYGFIFPSFIRHTQEPIPIDRLPPIDVVSVSHNHGDHFDRSTLKQLAKTARPAVFVPPGMENWFLDNDYNVVVGKTWWERSLVTREGRTVTLTAVPALHWSQSGIFDTNRSLWMGVMIESEQARIYYAGDTGYDEAMLREIKRQFGPIDVALLPIAPEGFTHNHMNLEQSLDAFALLGARKMIPIHYGAYRTGTEKIEEPLNLLLEAVQERGIADQVIALPLGGTYTVERGWPISDLLCTGLKIESCTLASILELVETSQNV